MCLGVCVCVCLTNIPPNQDFILSRIIVGSHTLTETQTWTFQNWPGLFGIPFLGRQPINSDLPSRYCLGEGSLETN